VALPVQRFEFPPLPGSSEAPQWTGERFVVTGGARRVLSYGAEPSGWTDHLTDLHEDTAGSNHFIDIASRRHAVLEAKRVHGRRPHVLLEVGVSSGYLLQDLRSDLPQASIIGSDYTLGTLENAAHRLEGVPLLQFDLAECPLPDACVDTVILLNVLEHIERDAQAVAQLHRILRPGGAAIIEVPAGEALYDSYDRALLHWRRYSMTRLVELLSGAGFSIERRSHLGFFLYPGFWLAKKLRRAAPVKDDRLDENVQRSIAATSTAGGVGNAIMAAEARLRAMVYLPFGIRCLVTGRKPGP
jgi:SAM-dependent methyltransferase